MLFDIIMTRFPKNYNPLIIYDNSCKLKEFGLNREPGRFMNLQITTDKFHEINHIACSDSFKSSMYDDLDKANTQACEQTNRDLRKINKSTTFMKTDMYLNAFKFFMAHLNLNKNR